MKKLKTLLCGLFAAAMITGCSQDVISGQDPETPVEGNESDEFFAALDFLMPNGKIDSRSTTIDPENPNYGPSASSSGIEVGKDYENQVSSALIILAKYAPGNAEENYGFIAATEVKSNRISSIRVDNEDGYRALGRIQRTAIYELYEDLGDLTEAPLVYVFVFCNPTKHLIDLCTGPITFGNTDWIDWVCDVKQGVTGVTDENRSIWAPGSFLMNNVRPTTRALPIKVTDWENFNKSENPFHLSDDNSTEANPTLPNNSNFYNTERGAVRMERSVARFDFKDGSKKFGTDEPNNNTYDVLFHRHNNVVQNGLNGTEYEPLVKVELQRMCLVNMSNEFYYLKRVSNKGLNLTSSNTRPTGWRLCGSEKPFTIVNGQAADDGNYVVGPYATYFLSGVSESFSTYFNYPFFEDDGTFNNSTMASDQWDVYAINDVLKKDGPKDNYKNSEYNIWRYVTENVIPAGPEKQVNGISTGVVFKGRLLGGDYAENENLSSVEKSWESDFHKNLAFCLDGKSFADVISGETHKPITGSATNDPILYYIDSHLYMSWEHLRQAAIQASVTLVNNSIVINRSNSLYRAVFGDGPIPNGMVLYVNDDVNDKQPINDSMWTDEPVDAKEKNEKSADYAWQLWVNAGRPVSEIGQTVPASFANMRDVMTNTSGITIYQSSTDDGVPGYYCYYYYWNRHNDNGIDGVMGPMEFDVVRNNVYKLSVDKISRLGHPRVPENDPDNPTPDTPDESANLYLDVNVQVIPWSVRENSITF